MNKVYCVVVVLWPMACRCGPGPVPTGHGGQPQAASGPGLCVLLFESPAGDSSGRLGRLELTFSHVAPALASHHAPHFSNGKFATFQRPPPRHPSSHDAERAADCQTNSQHISTLMRKLLPVGYIRYSLRMGFKTSVFFARFLAGEAGSALLRRADSCCRCIYFHLLALLRPHQSCRPRLPS